MNPIPSWEHRPHPKNADKAGMYILNLAVRIPFTSHSEHVSLRRAGRRWVREAGELIARAPTCDTVLAQCIADGSRSPREPGLAATCRGLLSANVSVGSRSHSCPPLPTWNSIPFCIKDLKMLSDWLLRTTAALWAK